MQSNQLVLISPRPNTTYRITPNLNSSAQRLLIEALAGQGISQVTFWVDGNLLASVFDAPFQAWWPLSAGEHQIWAEAVDANGGTIKSDAVTITVIGK